MIVITLDANNKGSHVTLSNGNLTANIPNYNNSARATEGKNSGKWYWEVTFISLSNVIVGIVDDSVSMSSTIGTSSHARMYYSDSGEISYPRAVYGMKYSANDVVGVKLDLDNNILEFLLNGVSQGKITNFRSDFRGDIFPVISSWSSSSGSTSIMNFGASPFIYDMEDGYLAYDSESAKKFNTRAIFKNPQTNQHYSLAEKALIPLPDSSSKNMILHGIEAGKEIKLDEAFTTIRHITENEDGTQEVVDEEVEPFSVYGHISENPQVIIYTESTDDIIVSTATEPYDLYDEFGENVEVLYYTDDESVTEADLILEANWSPIDELEGDFEVVTWTDESVDTAQRVLRLDAVPQPQIIYTEINNVINQVYQIKADAFNTNPHSSVKFLFSKVFGVFTTFSGGNPVTVLDVETAWDSALTAAEVSQLGELTIKTVTDGGYRLVVLLNQHIRDYEGPSVSSIAVTQDVATESPTVDALEINIVKSLLLLDLDFRISVLDGKVIDEDGGEFKYRLELNGLQIFPTETSKNWSDWVIAPYNVYSQLLSSQIKLGETNTLSIFVEDHFGYSDRKDFVFEGEYSGLLFKDPLTGYYTTDAGEILQYLLAGTLQQGQTSPEYEVYLINNNPFAVNEVQLVGTANSEGVTIELSKSNPFVNEGILTWSEVMEYKDMNIFHLRLRVEKDAVITPDGMFTVTATSEIVQ